MTRTPAAGAPVFGIFSLWLSNRELLFDNTVTAEALSREDVDAALQSQIRHIETTYGKSLDHEQMLRIRGRKSSSIPASGRLPGNRLSSWHGLSLGRWHHQAHVDYVESQAVDPLHQT